jgi:hypothetical protein
VDYIQEKTSASQVDACDDICDPRDIAKTGLLTPVRSEIKPLGDDAGSKWGRVGV